VEPSGNAIDFWERYPEHLERAAAAGCDAIRIGVEWARCEPEEGSYDDSAFVRYRDILVACRELGLEPLVTLHHFTHPWWLGEELWLDLDAPHRFATWARDAVSRLGAHCNRWVTVNEPNILALQTWFTGDFPPARHVPNRMPGCPSHDPARWSCTTKRWETATACRCCSSWG
jgi:beta-glucosidase/6-phospho-beta-glucosidase/beta-galactosidase